LAKGNIGGTIAHVYVTEGAPEPGARGERAHALDRRARMDIVRI
jgi:DNA polymerase alpha subunit B